MLNIILLTTLLAIMIMTLLDRYIYLFYKLLATLINLIKKITMSLMIKDIQFLKNYNKIWKKVEI